MAESEAYSLRAAVSRGKLTTEHWKTIIVVFSLYPSDFPNIRTVICERKNTLLGMMRYRVFFLTGTPQ